MQEREELQAELDNAYDDLFKAQALVKSLIDRLTDLEETDNMAGDYNEAPWGEQQAQIDWLETRYETDYIGEDDAY